MIWDIVDLDSINGSKSPRRGRRMNSGTGTCGRNRSLMRMGIATHQITGLRLGEVSAYSSNEAGHSNTLVRERLGV